MFSIVLLFDWTLLVSDDPTLSFIPQKRWVILLINCRDIVLFPQSFPTIDDSLTLCDTLSFLRLSVAWWEMDLCFVLQDTVTLGLFLLFGKFFGGKLPSIFSSGCRQGEFSSPPCVSCLAVSYHLCSLLVALGESCYRCPASFIRQRRWIFWLINWWMWGRRSYSMLIGQTFSSSHCFWRCFLGKIAGYKLFLKEA